MDVLGFLRRKSVIICITVFMISLLGVGVVIGQQNQWAIFKKESGLLTNSNEVDIRQPGVQEIEAYIQSIDPKSGLPTKKLEADVTGLSNKQSITFTMVNMSTGHCLVRTFKYLSCQIVSQVSSNFIIICM